MPVIRSTDAAEHRIHGSTFSSFVAPSSGGSELCAWKLQVPARLPGVTHQPSREEVLLLLEGELKVTLDGVVTNVAPGDVVLVPARSAFRVDGGGLDATAWVTTTPGLEAVMDDGTRTAPPWAN